ERIHRRLDAVRGRDPRRRGDARRPERPSRGGPAPGRERAHAQLEPRIDFRRRRCGGGPAMTDQLTRAQLLRRGVAAGGVLTLPGLLAACGGGGIKGAQGTTGETATVSKKLAKTITFSNWPLYIDVDEKTKKHPSLDQFTKQT